MRLDRYLANLQYGTRRVVKQIIKANRVTIDGVLVRDGSATVAAGAQVAVDGLPVGGDLQVYYLMNKPSGVLTANRDATQKTVLDLLTPADLRPGLYPVGRLDKDTTGLLLITNDGMLGHALLAPKRHVPKTYLVNLAVPLTASMQTQLEEGLTFKEFVSAPATVKVRPQNDDRQIELTIHEGKFHQVKRMVKAVGNEVIALQRLSMGPLSLPAELPVGHYRPLTPAEVGSLTALVASDKRSLAKKND